MDILIGGIPAVQVGDRGTAQLSGAPIEGTLLALRSPRGTRGSGDPRRVPAEDRRRGKASRPADPPGSKVLTVLIVDPSGIPKDLGTTPYRVLVRFVRSA